MRHIPEDELHAYLDQALSRSQAVEIERHLARCPACQAERDAIAALRDRTTDLLARLGSPPSVIPPPFEMLLARHRAARARRLMWLRRGGLAAGIAGLAIVGRTLIWPGNPSPEAVLTAATIEAAAPRTPAVVPNASFAEHGPRPPTVRTAPEPAAAERSLMRRSDNPEPVSFGFAKAVETDPEFSRAPGPLGAEAESAAGAAAIRDAEVQAVPVDSDPELSGLWRTVALDSDTPPSSDLPLVPGLSVVRLRMQPGANGAEVVAVDQVLETGEMVRTISGPAGRVGALVAQEAGADSSQGRVTFTIRQADRMVAVTGPPDVLSSLLSRVSGRRRY